jgi:hypothetical protein
MLLKKHGSCWNYISYRKEEILGKSGRVIQVYWLWKAYQSRKHVQYTCCISSLCFFINFTMVEESWGVAVIEKLNNAKAALLYAEIDRNPLFKGAAVEDRSMNATVKWRVTCGNFWCNVESRRNIWNTRTPFSGWLTDFNVQCTTNRKCSGFLT